ncbi:MAG: hypothetical protein ACOYOK_15985, partial [Pseudobdellovibrionaceae bacterium]
TELDRTYFVSNYRLALTMMRFLNHADENERVGFNGYDEIYWRYQNGISYRDFGDDFKETFFEQIPFGNAVSVDRGNAVSVDRGNAVSVDRGNAVSVDRGHISAASEQENSKQKLGMTYKNEKILAMKYALPIYDSINKKPVLFSQICIANFSCYFLTLLTKSELGIRPNVYVADYPINASDINEDLKQINQPKQKNTSICSVKYTGKENFTIYAQIVRRKSQTEKLKFEMQNFKQLGDFFKNYYYKINDDNPKKIKLQTRGLFVNDQSAVVLNPEQQAINMKSYFPYITLSWQDKPDQAKTVVSLPCYLSEGEDAEFKDATPTKLINVEEL